MATRVYNWKGKRYTDETLSEAPADLLKALEERGVEVNATAKKGAQATASKTTRMPASETENG